MSMSRVLLGLGVVAGIGGSAALLKTGLSRCIIKKNLEHVGDISHLDPTREGYNIGVGVFAFPPGVYVCGSIDKELTQKAKRFNEERTRVSITYDQYACASLFGSTKCKITDIQPYRCTALDSDDTPSFKK